MATFSILENVRINDSHVAEALVSAIEESERVSPRQRSSRTDFRMATNDDLVHLYETEKQRRRVNG
ncbi:MAG: hypothetical protein IJ679_06590 [Lachnospiraceae bacterium]|nr:hypothetical protein [Lachnospiraceae bacterium]